MTEQLYTHGRWMVKAGKEERFQAAWRADAGFQDRVGAVRELLESFEPRTLRLVVQR